MFQSNITFRDQLLEIQKKNTKKYSWPKKVLEHLLNIAVVNSIVIRRILSEQAVSVLDFKIELMKQLQKVANRHKVEICILMTEVVANKQDICWSLLGAKTAAIFVKYSNRCFVCL